MPDKESIPNRLAVTAEFRSPMSANGKASAGKGWFRCQVQPDADASGFSVELAALLQNRLRLAATIMACTFLAVNVLQLIRPEIIPLRLLDQLINYGAFLLIGGIAGLLWWRQGFQLCQLRRLEGVLFTAVACHFAYISVCLLEEAASTATFTSAPKGELGFRLAMFSFLFIFRWCMLIIIYGVFIPNQAWKTALASLLFTAVPLGMLLHFTAEQGFLLRYLADVFPYNLMVLALSAAVAIFGSHKIATLSQEAYTSRQLGQYRLKNRLGYGGMGEVFLAEHLLLKRPCVVKLIRSERAADPSTQARFEREVKAMATLTHWNTVAVFDYGRTVDGTFYYVMEYLPGLSLQELVATYGAMPAARVVALLRQVCAALHEAHAIGLIHRDIKPSNILVCPWGGLHDVVKLLDFGLVLHGATRASASADEGKLTREGFIVGTPDFLSPEQAQDGDTVDGRSDLYSLGAVGYFLLTGQTVFPRKNAMQVVVAHVHEPVPPLPSSIPRPLVAIVRRCLEKRPADRFQTGKELDEALAEVAADLPWREEDAATWWTAHRNIDKAAQYDQPTLITAGAS